MVKEKLGRFFNNDDDVDDVGVLLGFHLGAKSWISFRCIGDSISDYLVG